MKNGPSTNIIPVVTTKENEGEEDRFGEYYDKFRIEVFKNVLRS